MSLTESLHERITASESTVLLAGLFIPIAAFFLLVWAFPIAYALGMSLFEDPTRAPTFVGVQNYIEILTTWSFWRYLWYSVIYAVSTTVLSLLLGLVLALAVNRELRGGSALRTLMIFPYLLPTLVVIFLWTFMLDANVGIVNQWLQSIGILDESVAFFSTTAWAMPAVVITSVWKFGSFSFFIILARLQAIDPALYERAQIEGASAWQVFRDITAPQLRGAVLIILLVRGIWMFNKFDIIYLSTRGGPIDVTTTLPIRVYELAFSAIDFGAATALAGIMFAILAGTASVYFAVFKPAQEVS